MFKQIILCFVLSIVLLRLVATDEETSLIEKDLSGYYTMDFKVAPAMHYREKIQGIIKERLKIVGSNSADFRWVQKRLYCKPVEYMDRLVFDRYVAVRGAVKFNPVSEGGRAVSVPSVSKPEGIETVQVGNEVRGLEATSVAIGGDEPSGRSVTLQFNMAVQTDRLVCFIDGMPVGVVKTGSSDRGEFATSEPLAKLLKFCIETGCFPVELDKKLRHDEYTLRGEAWFPLPERLRDKLLENSHKFRARPLDDVPALPAYDEAVKKEFIAIPGSKAYLMEEAQILGRKVNAAVVEGVINLSSGFIEVAASRGAKLHETIIDLQTEVAPLDLLVTLTGLKRGRDLHDADSRAAILVQWLDKGRPVTYRLEDLIIDIVKLATMKRVGWFFQHSVIMKTDPLTMKEYELPLSFRSRIVASTQKMSDSMFNNPLPDEESMDDSRYVANLFILPPEGTRVSFVIFRAWKELIDEK